MAGLLVLAPAAQEDTERQYHQAEGDGNGQDCLDHHVTGRSASHQGGDHELG